MRLKAMLEDALKAIPDGASDHEVAQAIQRELNENKPAELDVAVSIKVRQLRSEAEATAEWLKENRRMYLRKLVEAIGLDNEIAVTGVWVDKKPLPLDHLLRPEAG